MPCPFCGGTRAVASLFQGNLLESISFNPLGLVAIAFLALTVILPRQVQQISKAIAAKWWNLRQGNQYLVLIAGFILLWGANLPRMI